jgi:hypothetical protein
MKKEFLFIILALILFVSPIISSEMIINQQPNKIYNLGDSISVPVTIVSLTGTSTTFSMDLLCGPKQINFYKNGVKLSGGEQKIMDASLVLTKDIVGEYIGTCKIKAMLPGDSVPYLLTNEFKISNLISIQPNTDQKEFSPGQSILIFGDAIKENGQDSNGFIDMNIIIGNSSAEDIIQSGTINNGMYSMNITFPANMRAGNYLVKLTAYEMTPDGLKTNKGFTNYNIAIKQIPTSLELVFENNKVVPGTNVRVKAILHDQTGDLINSNSIITIKKGETEIKIQSEKATGEYLEFPITYNEAPSNWIVFAISNQLTAQSNFTVIENKDINVDITNQTVTFINIGNVPYNDTVTIKIGENYSLAVPVFLPVDGTQKYELKAPNGEYEVEVLNENSQSKVKQSVVLTGRVVEAKDLSQSGFNIKPIIFILIGLIVLVIIFIFIRKAYRNKKNYGTGSGLGLFKKKVKQPKVNVAWENRAMPLSKNSKLETKNRASLSLSIKGSKQDISIVDVNIKNLREIQEKKGNAEEELQKIINIAENKRAFVYENQNNLFLILSPSKTRTMQNEAIALDIAQNAKEILSAHNKISKHNLDFGISVEYGSIVEKTENGIMEFMSLGTLMSNAKKIASSAQGEVLLGEKIKDKLINVRTEKQSNSKVPAYKVKEIKYHDEEHSRFIKSFLKKAEENKEDFKVI